MGCVAQAGNDIVELFEILVMDFYLSGLAARRQRNSEAKRICQLALERDGITVAIG